MKMHRVPPIPRATKRCSLRSVSLFLLGSRICVRRHKWQVSIFLCRVGSGGLNASA